MVEWKIQQFECSGRERAVYHGAAICLAQRGLVVINRVKIMKTFEINDKVYLGIGIYLAWHKNERYSKNCSKINIGSDKHSECFRKPLTKTK